MNFAEAARRLQKEILIAKEVQASPPMTDCPWCDWPLGIRRDGVPGGARKFHVCARCSAEWEETTAGNFYRVKAGRGGRLRLLLEKD